MVELAASGEVKVMATDVCEASTTNGETMSLALGCDPE